ncbi:MAG: prolyl oligopeptidase family serine peptidase [Phaeodactylibacter sp.]|nr:prolyl oligopeptidase family serine peptidase [Phaeodactylibacter sp.]
MKQFVWLALVFFSFRSGAQDFTQFEKRVFTNAAGDSLPYRILYPADYDSGKNYPLVLFLHGAGERGTDNEMQLKHGVYTFLQAEHRANFPCIVIAPQCPKEDYWANVDVNRSTQPFQLNFNYQQPLRTPLALALELVRQTIKKEAVDKKRVYITGLSMGGMGTLEAVNKHPKLFAAAAVVCGAGQVEAFEKKQAKLPMWLFHGADDLVVSVEHSRAMVDRLQEFGAPLRYTEYDGVKHNSWENAYAEPELLPWLFAQKR